MQVWHYQQGWHAPVRVALVPLLLLSRLRTARPPAALLPPRARGGGRRARRHRRHARLRIGQREHDRATNDGARFECHERRSADRRCT